MRILLITDNHTPTGGAERYFFELKARLKNQPDFTVYSIGFGPKNESGKDFLILKNTKSKLTKLFWQLVFNPKVYSTLRKQIKAFNPDIIHLHNAKQYTISTLAALKSYPVVQTIHDYTVICPTGLNLHKDHTICETGIRANCFFQHQTKYNPIIYLGLTYAFLKFKRRLKKIVSVFLAPSPLLVEYLTKNQFQNATYVAPFNNKPNAYSFDTIKSNHFLFAGHLGLHKGVDLLMNEFAQACAINPQLILTIAGTGPDETKLREKIKTHNIEKNVRFIGWQTDLTQYYQESVAVIFPSIGLEAFGLVMTEGMSHARPIIGINRGTSAWIIEDNQTGLLFDPYKKGDLAKKILNLANNPSLAQELGVNAYHKLDALIDNDKAMQQIINAYRSAQTKSQPINK